MAKGFKAVDPAQFIEQGFTYVRTVVLPHNPSGALFQRPARRVPTPRLQYADALTR